MSSSKLFKTYQVSAAVWDEMFAQDYTRRHYESVQGYLETVRDEDLSKKEELAKSLFMSQGVTFTVYSSGEGIEKIFPFDIIPDTPRVLAGLNTRGSIKLSSTRL